MRLLFEPSFPALHLSFLESPGVTVIRAGSTERPDVALVTEAASQRCNALVLLGRSALGRSDLLEAAAKEQLTLVATETYNPIDAIDYLRDNLGALMRLVPGARTLLVQSDGVLVVEGSTRP